jgi:LysR family glycine cleavage system transcriptional activator
MLEQRLGIALFHRTHRSVELTDIGRRYAESVSEAFSLIEASTRSIERAGKSDILTIHSVPSIAAQWLMPRLSRFSAMHADIDVRLNASAAPVDLAAGEADFDIRYGNFFPDAGVMVEAFPAERIVVNCSTSVRPGRRLPKKGFSLNGKTLIHTEVNRYTWRDWSKDHPEHSIDLERGPRFDRSFMAINCAVDGLGVALESTLLIERELESKKLVLPFGLVGPQIVCHQLTYLKSKGHIQKMKAFREWLFEELDQSMTNLS